MKHSTILYMACLLATACDGKSESNNLPDATKQRSERAAADAGDAAADDKGLGNVVAAAVDRAQPPTPTPTPAAVAAPNRPVGPVGPVESKMKVPDGAPADVAAPPADATVTASGLAYKVLTPGEGGIKPGPTDKVEVHYSGWTTDGKEFDSSIRRGRTASFGLDKVIPGWTEGVQLMTLGETTRFWIPEKLAYEGKPGRPQGMLVFDIELLGFVVPPPPPPTPPDVAAPPADATKTTSGIAYKVLTAGTGTTHPGPTSTVEVHYSGWTTDGKMFDSSITRGRPATFPLDRVIPGWTEAVQLMVVGDKTRFWIPKELAYEGKPGRPQGMLVFEIQLLSIK